MRSLVLSPVLRGAPAGPRSAEARLEEAVGLAHAIDLDVVHDEVVRLSQLRPATLLGSGAVERFKDLIAAEEIGLVVVDWALTPVQQRNLEKAWGCKVIDRTGLILEIFGARARTAEGKLQVELAALSYQRSRLVRSWTHLERQRGGFGFLGGPGESQLEIDRRLIGQRIAKLKKELEDVKRTRGLQRKARRRVPLPVVALVGYTNAGKSTLFNALTRSAVMAKDLLFATLDPTIRTMKLPSGRSIALSDTVGFISELPTDLVAAFRATLEEVVEADIVLHLRDIAHPDSSAQALDVEEVLKDLETDALHGHTVIEVLNKIDLLPVEDRAKLKARIRDGSGFPVSAVTGEGIGELLAEIDRRLAAGQGTARYRLRHNEGEAIAWLYSHGTVLDRRDDEEFTYMTVSLGQEERARFERLQRHHA
ncbi:MAG TPA: GTPase HflX [Dongiaceae bacterium]|nr:GTPase HflX [Dongiaceae bacterium]